MKLKHIPIIATIAGILVVVTLTSLIAGITGGQQNLDSNDGCGGDSELTDTGGDNSPNLSRMEFAKAHRAAYIEGWKNYGFLPSANLTQAIVETGLDTHVPSFGQNHNSGGVKWSSSIKDYDTYKNGWSKSPSEANTGGSVVGDGTGGGYVWYKDFDAGIIGKAEFLARNSRYAAAVNNTDPQATFKAIFEAGWATDPGYLISLNKMYSSGGITSKFLQDMDKEAIDKYGSHPFKKLGDNNLEHPGSSTGTDDTDTDECSADDSTSGEGTPNGAPVIDIPAQYKGKVSPMPDAKTYPGNGYPMGQCTWGAYNRMAQLGNHIEYFAGAIGGGAYAGDGGWWWQTAKQKGYTVVKGKPKVGWAVSFPPGVAGSDSVHGHIAVVEYVNDDGSFLVSETNVVNSGSGTRSWRVISKGTGNQAYFIEGKK